MALTTRKGTAFTNPSKATRQQIPPFLSKLYHMVNDHNTDSLIRWSDAGDSFYVYDHERFAKEVLPHWFKHGNFGSFVRQLNNYGFHKVPHLQQGVLRSDGETEISHFENQYFQRGQSDLLCLIQRKKQTQNDPREESPDFKEPVTSSSIQVNGTESEPTQTSHNVKGAVLDINGIVNGVQAIKRHQHAISSELKELHQSNQSLWQEAFAARERHKKHHDTITRILKFLAGVFGQTGNNSPRAQEVPHDTPGESSSSNAIVHRRQNRLMIENGVDLEGKANEVLNRMHLNIDDFMEPLDFEGGRANDGDRFVTIETPGSRPTTPNPSTPKKETIPASPPQDALLNTTSNSLSQPNIPSPTPIPDFLSPSTATQTPPAVSSQFTPDYSLFDPNPNTGALTSSNLQTDQTVQNAVISLLNNPAQLQRVLAALQSQLPVSMPPEPGPVPEHKDIPRDLPSAPSFNFRPSPDGQLSPGSTLSLLSAATNLGNLSLSSDGDDVAALNALAQSSNQLQKSYKDAADVEADVNALQGHIDSLIASLGLDETAAAALRGEASLHPDDDIVSSSASNSHPQTVPAPQMPDANADFDFDAFLSHDFDASAGLGGLGSGSGFDVLAQQNGAERLGAFLDEVRSVSNESDVTAGSIPEADASLPQDVAMHAPGKIEGVSKKRKSDVAGLVDETRTLKTVRTKKKR